MSRVRLQQSISLDGFAAGPRTSHEHPLGVNGERLHAWMDDDQPASRAVGAATFEGVGAVVVGRRMLDVGLPIWDADTFHRLPVFVPTHRGGDPLVVPGGSTFTLVTGDHASGAVVAALQSAREAAGGRDVALFGGPTTARAALAAGLVDELRLQVVHTLLGEGERLFDRQDAALASFRRVAESGAPGVSHVTLVRG